MIFFFSLISNNYPLSESTVVEANLVVDLGEEVYSKKNMFKPKDYKVALK